MPKALRLSKDEMARLEREVMDRAEQYDEQPTPDPDYDDF